MSNLYRYLPSVDELLSRLGSESIAQNLPRAMLKDLVNEFLQQCRKQIQQGIIAGEAELQSETLLEHLRAFVGKQSKPHFRRVINATGVVVHTNLGRSLLSGAAIRAVEEACGRYSNLEFDLATGKRGSRYSHVESILCRITGAESGLVVNNGAAAVLLILDTFAKGKEVVVSRGELVEIGGSFRIPDVMTKSGAILKEVGATNRTHLYDYENAIAPETGALMKVHTSNFRIQGFHKAVSVQELAKLAEPHSIPVIEDLGSGNLFSFEPAMGLNEPTVQEAVSSGADVVCFSGDKLLGGPQAGIILGNRKYIDAIKKNPMNRALRIDKMTLAALEATLRLYLDPEMARKEVPTLRMITATPRELSSRAGRLAGLLRRTFKDRFRVEVIPSVSRVGGGALPEKDLPTSLVGLVPLEQGVSVDLLKDILLATDPPVVGRIEQDMFCLDPRTLLKDDTKDLVSALEQALAAAAENPV